MAANIYEHIAERGGELIATMQDPGGEGVVLWKDAKGEYITHRWGLDDQGRVMTVSGHYFKERLAAQRDYEQRAGLRSAR